MSIHTHTRSFGQGPRRALAIHCSLAHSGTWAGVAEALGDDLTTLAYDLPCHGRSGDWDGTGNLHDFATDMARGLIDVADTGPVDLIGHSFGATVALRLAIENPELVRSFTMIEPVYWAAVQADEPERFARSMAGHEVFVAAMDRGDRMGAARAFNRAWGDGTPWDNFPETLRQYMADRIHFVAGSSPFLGDDSAGLLNPGMFDCATAPALLIEGGASGDVADAINSSIERRLPNVARAVIDGAGHMAPITHPEPVAAAIRELLARS
ncbi:MAG: lipase [Ascidiaceihabitans sp.]|jgi:lipase